MSNESLGKMKTTRTLPVIIVCLLPALLQAQGSAGTGGTIEPRFLVDVPTAGLLPKGTMCLDADFYQEGGVLLGVSFGLFDRVSLGVSYGGTRLIGSDPPEMNATPGMNLKIRVLEESIALPALVLGFDSQGRDGYFKDLHRYKIKSPGFFAALSKNYSFLGFFSIHGGSNYSLENADDDKDPNAFLGVEKSLGSFLSAVVEYNLGANDSNGKAPGRGRGFLNMGLRCSLGGGLTLGINLKDLTKNSGTISVANRTVRMEYVRFL